MIRVSLILAFLASVTVLSAQSPALPQTQPPLAFEVASVRPNTSRDTRWSMAWPKGSFSATNMPLRLLIADAYDIRQFQRFMLVGGPEELLAERYDIQARSPEPAPEGQHFAMLRSLLVERFRLRVHRETRHIPSYAVTIAREGALGPDLRSSPHDCAAFAAAGGRRTDENAPTGADGQPVCFVGDTFRAGLLTKQNAGPLTQLLARVQGFVDRPLSDATGLTGSYQWRLEFSASGPTADSPHPSIYTAFREQLGLKLEPRTGPVEMLVIDSVERPRPD